jgi:signal transduction histidine kinase
MLRIAGKYFLISVIVLMILIISGCDLFIKKPSGLSMENISYRDVPGITEEEINAIERFQKQNISFVYGVTAGTEAFLKKNGEVGGYAALFANWLSTLFGVQFIPRIYNWDDILDKLNNGEIDFTYLTVTEEREKIYYFSDPIAQNVIKTMRLDDSQISSPARYAFMKGTVTFDAVTEKLAPDSYEAVMVNDYDDAYRVLRDKQADAFIELGFAEGAFDQYIEMVFDDFYPLIFVPLSLVTENPELKPLISVLTKALRNGGIRYLTELHHNGYKDYRAHKLSLRLTEEEQQYIEDNPVIKIGALYYNYPIEFYNTREKEWQGFIFDILDEVSELTGLSFNVATGINTGWSDLLQILENGEISLIPQLGRTSGREDRYLWPETVIMQDYFVLISRLDFPDLKINDILAARVGLVKDYSHTAIFHTWFPNHNYTTEYDTFDITVAALEAGEIDVMIGNRVQLLSLINYEERTGFKVNYVFNYTYDIYPGFNKEETILINILDKAFALIDVNELSDHWIRITYDYQSKLLQAQRPWLIGAIFLSLTVLALVSVLFVKNRNAGKILERLVQERTAELEIAMEAANAASQSKSSFLANMSHELRTPLNVVIGLTDLVLEENDLTDYISENLRKINNAGSTLLGIVNDILDFSKIETGKITLMPVEYHIPSLLNDIITLMIVRLGEKPVTFKLNINEDLPNMLLGDDLRVKQIFNNLLSNALKYTQSGYIELAVNCTRDGENSFLMDISISDTGIGITKEDLEKLFSDYYQVESKANRKIEGTGLGLSITKRLVEMMDGKISAESEVGKGTAFHVCIRQGYVDDVKIGNVIVENLRKFNYIEDKKIKNTKLKRIDLSFAKVLVVDDMQTNLDVASGLLRKYRMQVDCVTSGYDAIDIIKSGDPVYNIIFMDHMMPGIDGIETANRIRLLDSEYARKIPIVALTANAIQGTETLFYSNDFQEFLSKPIDIIQMDSIIRKLIRRK